MPATTIYNYPTTGTVPPTVAQAALVNVMTVQVGFSNDGDTTATVTHNWACPSLTNIGAITPLTSVVQTDGTAPIAVSLTLTSSLVCTLTKISAAGSVGTWTVLLMR